MTFVLLMPDGVLKPPDSALSHAMGQVEQMMDKILAQAPDLDYESLLFSAVMSAYFLGALEGGNAVHAKYLSRTVVQ